MICLVIYDTDHFKIINCVGIKDCVTQLADYFGDNSTLFNMALKGCDTPESCVEMFNHFSQYQINAIYSVHETIYEKE